MSFVSEIHTSLSRSLLKPILIGILALTVAACGKDDTKTKNIGFLLGVDVFKNVFEGFKNGMTEQGHFDGKNVVYHLSAAKGDRAQMKSMCEDFVAKKVDLIVTTTNGAALACKAAIKGHNIPMVFTVVLSPVRSGVVDNLQAPSNNITGVRNPLDEFIGKRLEFFKTMAPGARRIWLPVNTNYPTTKHFLTALRDGAKQMDLELMEQEIKSTSEIIDYLGSLDTAPFDAIFIPPNPAPQSKEGYEAITNFADMHQLPIIGNTLRQVEQGALFSYHVDKKQVGHQAAYLVNQVLSSKDTIPFPVINGEPDLVLNLSKIRALGLKTDNALISFARTIIE
ncbi:MAG: ABC transporter substrate-binding protein [Magnetovibrio sp.]|nr:ABC transporter substrate-binding protein [Magnetovibrio sp.]